MAMTSKMRNVLSFVAFASATVGVPPALAQQDYPARTIRVINLVPVSQLVSSGMILAVHPSVPARNLSEFLALAKRRREGLNFGSNGSGTTSHLVGEWLQHLGGFRFTHVPYKGYTPALAAILGGEVDVITPGAGTTAAELIKAGKLRGIAVTMLRKSSVLPELPLVASVFPGFDVDNWMGMWAPAGTAPAIIDKLYAELANGMQHPDFNQVLERGGDDRAVGSTPAEFTAHFRCEIDKYAKIIRVAGIKPEV
jgi:tripartite-type tricarboxylate transporter receptor subunit TctC